MAKQADFNHVDEKHAAIHERLEEWAIWVRPRSASFVQPMFRQFRSAEGWFPTEARASVDPLKAQLTEKAVTSLPDDYRASIQWCYVYRTNPRKACKALGVSPNGLVELIRDGRQMLVNRGLTTANGYVYSRFNSARISHKATHPFGGVGVT